MNITYRGYIVDTVVGEVTQPDHKGNRWVATAATFDATTNLTRVNYEPLPLDTALVQYAPGFLRVAPEATDG